MFHGFSVEALDFYDDLELDNTRSFWTAHQQVYADAVRAPMVALAEALEPEFGTASVFRPYRDLRFGKDKTPYKVAQGAFVPVGRATGWYVQVSAAGILVAAGFHHPVPEPLRAIRAAIADERRGEVLRRHVDRLRLAGFDVGGETLKTTPRGYAADHPRIDLLRHKQLLVSRSYGFDPVIHTPELLDRVREDWRAFGPLVRWIGEATEG